MGGTLGIARDENLKPDQLMEGGKGTDGARKSEKCSRKNVWKAAAQTERRGDKKVRTASKSVSRAGTRVFLKRYTRSTQKGGERSKKT